jgi:hypothetical protein
VRFVARAAAITFVLAGIVLGVLVVVDDESAVLAVAYGVAIAAPGLVALASRRPVTVGAAGLGGCLVAFMASFGVTLPLLLPGIALLSTGIDDVEGAPTRGDVVRAAIVVVAITWAVLVAIRWDSLLSVALTAVAVAAARVR